MPLTTPLTTRGSLKIGLLVLLSWSAGLQPAGAQTTVSSQLRLAVGMTQRHVDAPSDSGRRQLDLGPTPAVLLGVDAAAHSGKLDLGVDISYRSSVAGRTRDADAGPNADTSQTAVRSHQLQVGARAVMRLGADESSSTLALFAGYSVRAFASVAELRMPRFSLHGPVARIELELPLPAAGLRLRLAPEAQWLPSISDALRALAGISGSAIAIGGEAQLRLPLSSGFNLLLDYRESHAWAAARAAHSFSDAERYLLLGASYAWL
jgi:hypothetical protein